MISPRWKKVWRDLLITRGRILIMVLAIGISLFGVGTILSAYTVLSREISRNYLGTNPATAFLTVDHLDTDLIQAASQLPYIRTAEATSWVTARVEVKPNEWMPMLLFVIPDFNGMRLNTFSPVSGDWPPADQTMFVEQAALPLTHAEVGDSIMIQTPNGPKSPIKIAGLVHDPGLAPAWQEETVYAYITPKTLAMLGEGEDLHILKIQFKDQASGNLAIEADVARLVSWLKANGRSVDEIRIPPVGTHPHQSQMNSILTMLLIFSLLALVLSAILTATILGGLLAQQTRQIGIMKAIGARSSQIGGLYLLMVGMIGVVAVVVGFPAGNAVGVVFAEIVGELLNFTIYSKELPVWVYLVEALMGILAPLFVTLFPIWRTSHITVRESVSDYGISREVSSRRLDGWLGRIRGSNLPLVLSFRNTFRRPGRLILVLALLSSAGGMFITGLSVKDGWEAYLAQAASSRHYDLELRFNSPQSFEKVATLINSLPNVQEIESWNISPAALSRPDGLNIVRTYPDGGHGSFSLRSAPQDSSLMDAPILDGRWLQKGSTDEVVLNQMAAGFFPNKTIGDDLELTVNGRSVKVRLVGVVRQILTPATAYVDPATFAKSSGISPANTNAVRIVFNQHGPEAVRQATGEVERELEKESIRMKVVISETMLESATSGHVYIFIFALVLIAVIMAVVGVLGLMSSMSTSVIERTREFGIMRAIGARSRQIEQSVIVEGAFTSLLSWLIAVPVSIPLTLGIDYLVGNLSFRAPLPLTISPLAILGNLIAILAISIGITFFPARQASRLTVRETLTYI